MREQSIAEAREQARVAFEEWNTATDKHERKTALIKLLQWTTKVNDLIEAKFGAFRDEK